MFGKQTDLEHKNRIVYASEWPPGNPKAIQKTDKGVGAGNRQGKEERLQASVAA